MVWCKDLQIALLIQLISQSHIPRAVNELSQTPAPTVENELREKPIYPNTPQ